MPKENKRDTYMSKSIIRALDHLLERLIGEDMEIVIKINLKKGEQDENS